ncbi:MAG: hypothetical protein AABX40_04565 [Candidatus Hydrothermarchaeota archaeon]
MIIGVSTEKRVACHVDVAANIHRNAVGFVIASAVVGAVPDLNGHFFSGNPSCQ